MIGLKRGTVQLVPYQPDWVRLFDAEKQVLSDTFGADIIAIEHIGSTAIVGLTAKPIIDMAIGVASLATALNMQADFAKLGYSHRPNSANEHEELYVKGAEVERTHYAHVSVYGAQQWLDTVFFRDFLRNDPALVCQYAELKTELAAKYAADRAAYTQSKATFIQTVLKTGRA